MKIKELFESYSDKELITMAKKIGEEMYGKSHTGLVFSPEIQHTTYAEYAASSDAGPYVDTYDYVFFPSTGKGMDAADKKLSKKHVDKDGKIYIGGSNGVLVISDPFVAKKLPFPKDDFEKFKGLVLKHFPKATFTKPDRWQRVFAYDGKEMCGQFLSRNDNGDNKPAWLVHGTIKDNKIFAKHNW